MEGPAQGDYVVRAVDAELDELLPHIAALHIDGAKGVGKSTTAARRASSRWSLDVPASSEVAMAQPSLILDDPRPVLIDEWQRVPSVWDAVKNRVSHDRTPGQFLLAGSAPSAGTTHSGAGRIVSVMMRPMTLPERGVHAPTVSMTDLMTGAKPAVSGACELELSDYTDEILASGLPGLRGLTGRPLQAQLDSYITRIVDVEIEEVSGRKVRHPGTLRAWLAAYAAATSTTASWDKIRAAASPGADRKPSKTTTIPYTEALRRLRVLDELPAWTPGNNHLRALTQGPKHHLMDPALAARLVRVSRDGLLHGRDPASPVPRDGTFLGALFESLVTLSVRVFAAASGGTVGHLRTKGGEREIDLCVSPADTAGVVAMEVKLAPNVNDDDVRHLLWLQRELGSEFLDGIVVTTGPHAYRRPDGIAVVPLGLLGP